MPADEHLPQESSKYHGNASEPYMCSKAASPPGVAWGIDYGYCRTSLDLHKTSEKVGSSDPRCPGSCPHKAPEWVAVKFSMVYASKGARVAAEVARAYRAGAPE